MTTKNFITLRLGIIFCGVVAALVALAVILSKCDRTTIKVEQNQNVAITPAMIASIKAIGEWEFLTINDEEYVDTVRKGFFSDDGLARVYYGTLRIGVDMSHTKDHTLQIENDTVLIATLPKVGLLDPQFIDEARTRSFYEKGKWDAQAREALYQRAKAMMLSRCMTTANLKRAEDNARKEFTHLFHIMGFKNVRIQFE